MLAAMFMGKHKWPSSLFFSSPCRSIYRSACIKKIVNGRYAQRTIQLRHEDVYIVDENCERVAEIEVAGYDLFGLVVGRDQGRLRRTTGYISFTHPSAFMCEPLPCFATFATVLLVACRMPRESWSL